MGQCLPVASAVRLPLFFLIASLNSGPAREFLFVSFSAGESCRRLRSDMRGELYPLSLDGGLVHAQTPFPVSLLFLFSFFLWQLRGFLHLTV